MTYLYNKPMMLFYWGAFILALVLATLTVVSDVFSHHDNFFCATAEGAYIPQVMQYIAQKALYLFGLAPCEPTDFLNYWALYHVYSLYILLWTGLLFTPIIAVAALVGF